MTLRKILRQMRHPIMVEVGLPAGIVIEPWRAGEPRLRLDQAWLISMHSVARGRKFPMLQNFLWGATEAALQVHAFGRARGDPFESGETT